MTQGNTVAVFNKTDLPSPERLPLPKNFPSVEVSALTGSGFDQLKHLIAALADSFRADVGDELIAINARHAQALEQATQSLISARANFSQKTPIELVSSDLRNALSAFGEIAGKIDNERILDKLFSTFCIGK